MLDAPFYPALIRAAQKGGFDPADALLFLASESNLSTQASNGFSHGLSQIDSQWLKDHGISVEDYLALPASKQVTYIERYLSTKPRFGPAGLGKAPWPNAVTLYQGNFLPSTLTESISPRFLLVAEDGSTESRKIAPEQSSRWYRDNARTLDPEKSGRITIGSLARRLQRIVDGKGPEGVSFLRALEKLNAAQIAAQVPSTVPRTAGVWGFARSAEREIESPFFEEELLHDGIEAEAPVLPVGIIPDHDGLRPLIPDGWADPPSVRTVEREGERKGAWKKIALSVVGVLLLALGIKRVARQPRGKRPRA